MKSLIKVVTQNPNILIVLGIIIRILTVIISPEIADSRNAHLLGDTFLRTGSIYKYTQGINPYPPLLIYYYAFIAFLSSNLHLPFVYLVKIVPVLSDVSIMLLLKRYLKNKKTLIWYALNPVVIVVSSAFGKEDLFIILFVLLTYLSYLNKKSIVYTSLLLGASIWLKAFPLLFFPLFFSKIKNIAQKIIFSIITLSPLTIIILPFILTDFQSINKTFLSYTGSADYGWLAIIKAISGVFSGESINFTPINHLLPDILNVSKYIFIASYLLLIYKLSKIKSSILKQIILTFLLFYIIYGGIGTNFIYWIIPFLILFNFHFAESYSIFGTLTMIFYILTQFYDPVLKYVNFPLFKTPTLLNFMYFMTLSFFWVFLIKLFLTIYKKND